MDMDWEKSRCHILRCSSRRLAEEFVQGIQDAWPGPGRRTSEPRGLSELLIDLDTPSLFAPPPLIILFCSAAYLNKQAQQFEPLIGAPCQGSGGLLLVVDGLSAREALAKRAQAVAALHSLDTPKQPRELHAWLVGRLHALPQGVQQASAVANALISHRGDQIDALLATIEQLSDYAEGPVSPTDVAALVGGSAARPVWDLLDALLSGRIERALELLYAGSGLPTEQVIISIVNELRSILGALASDDDAQACALSGAARKKNLFYTRQRGQRLGQRSCERLLRGLLQTLRQARSTGSDPQQLIEFFFLNAQRVIRPG